jgi:8-hydroxy-5-deazaflavin:NADPH oxidoreductase
VAQPRRGAPYSVATGSERGAGDDADAKADVVALFEEAGFAPIDLGDLATGGAMQQIHHPVAGLNLIRL